MLYPLTFRPIFKPRVWGGRRLAELYAKPLSPGTPVGESWEISDRPGDISIIANGPLAGQDLRWLMQNHAAELLGPAATREPPGRHHLSAHVFTEPPRPDRFPLLIKILDAREKLSLQVHPPAPKAAQLGGEPKTEMWYVAEATPGAELYVGLKRGVTRPEFERRIQAGTVADCFHRLEVRAGDAVFLPSGRVHALGAGLVIFEIQQNSDTTYRVFDWNRVGLDGKPRDLHIPQSLASIDFEDFEPALLGGDFAGDGPLKVRRLVSNTLFTVEACRTDTGATLPLPSGRMQILGLLSGQLRVVHGQAALPLSAGQFALLPASLTDAVLQSPSPVTFLRVEPAGMV